MWAPEEAPQIAADPYHSLHTLVAEAGGSEAAVRELDQRRFATELSHHALTRAHAGSTGLASGVGGGRHDVRAGQRDS